MTRTISAAEQRIQTFCGVEIVVDSSLQDNEVHDRQRSHLVPCAGSVVEHLQSFVFEQVSPERIRVGPGLMERLERELEPSLFFCSFSPAEWTFTRSWDHVKNRPTIEKRYVDPGPAAALEGFPDTPEEHLGRIQRAVGPALAAKYRAGQREHGGVLSQKPGLLAQAEDEAIDQATYLCTLREQIAKAVEELALEIEAYPCSAQGAPHLFRALHILRAILERPD